MLKVPEVCDACFETVRWWAACMQWLQAYSGNNLGLEHQDEQVDRFLSLRGTFVCLLPSSSA